MSTDLDALLDRLCAGDDAAAAEAFTRYAPHLRTVVRRRLSAPMRARFDSMDIVQSVWADLVKGLRRGEWRFANAGQLRAFLVKATRNRFLNRVRRHRRSLEREQPLPEGAAALPSAQPPPLEVAQAHDLWEQMLAACPPRHREVLRLKRQGLTSEEVAAQTGLHPSSVRRILYGVAARLARAHGAAPPSAPTG
jgi:RNA polymerase sigma-70 factor (ECF subfamily)